MFTIRLYKHTLDEVLSCYIYNVDVDVFEISQGLLLEISERYRKSKVK